jgi:cytochrome c-type biogenesis protein CcmH
MNSTLFIWAIIVFVIAALIPAWPLLSDPAGPRRKSLEQAFRNGFIDKNEYKDKLKALDAEPRKRRPQLAILLVLLMPVIGIWLYGRVGTPDALLLQAVSTPPTAEAGADGNMSFDQAISALEQRLFADPDNPANAEGWALLGNSYKNLGRYDDSLAAYQKANQLAPEDRNYQVDLAEALLFASSDGQMPPKALSILQEVLAVSPNNGKALWLIGVAAFQKEDFAGAIEYWVRLRDIVGDPAALESLEEQIARAQQGLAVQQGGSPADSMASMGMANDGMANAGGDAASGQVHVRIEISEEMAAQRSDDGILFVFARAPQGGPPLASLRLPAAELPLEVDLSDANAMIASRTISSEETVIIGARWSKTGEALPQSGDLEGYSGLVNLPMTGTVDVLIDSVR